MLAEMEWIQYPCYKGDKHINYTRKNKQKAVPE